MKKQLIFDKITFGDIHIDKMLSGGIPCRQITEFSGKSGSGKSQTMLQLALTVQWPKDRGGMSGSCIFIDTQQFIWKKRIKEISEHHLTKFGLGGRKSMNHIYILHKIGGLENLFNTILSLEKKIKISTTKPVHLIIIDSLYKQFSNYSIEINERNNVHLFYKIWEKLKYYAWYYNIAVVTTSSMNDSSVFKYFENSLEYSCYLLMRDSFKYGFLWSNFINNWIYVTNKALLDSLDNTLNTKPKQREYRIVYTEHMKLSFCHFEVTKAGLVSVV